MNIVCFVLFPDILDNIERSKVISTHTLVLLTCILILLHNTTYKNSQELQVLGSVVPAGPGSK